MPLTWDRYQDAQAQNNAPAVVWVGPCGSPATEIPTNFQQNPCYLNNWVLDLDAMINYNPKPAQYGTLESGTEISDLPGLEVEEAAADMLLGWTYQLFDTDPNDEALITDITGFGGKVWSNRSTFIADPTSGNARFEWMNCAQVVIFNQFGFWDTGTIIVPNSCTANYGLE